MERILCFVKLPFFCWKKHVSYWYSFFEPFFWNFSATTWETLNSGIHISLYHERFLASNSKIGSIQVNQWRNLSILRNYCNSQIPLSEELRTGKAIGEWFQLMEAPSGSLNVCVQVRMFNPRRTFSTSDVDSNPNSSAPELFRRGTFSAMPKKEKNLAISINSAILTVK